VVLLSGPRSSLTNLIETIKIFDVDWFAGKSFALFPVEYADVEKLSEEIALVLDVGDEAALARLIRFIPVPRLNALLVVTQQPKYLKMVADLVSYFDQGTQAGPGQRLFVYNLQHAEAEAIAETLQDIFGLDAGKGRSRAGGRAGSPLGLRGRSGSSVPPPVGGPAPVLDGAPPAVADELGLAARRVADREEGGGAGRGPISIKADPKNNALIVLASAPDYRAVESAIAKLDVPARQVLIEASIAEVTLTNNMRYGIRWFFEWGAGGYGVNVGFGDAQNNSGLNIAILNDASELRLLFDILEAETTVRFLSAPQVVVVDNETANFRVGDQIPVITRASQGTVSPDAPIVTEVEYKDTGTLLAVKPRINAGGSVNLTISQEVSVPGTAAAGSNPPIAQRTIDTTVVVQSGQTVMLAGLIRETRNNSESGVPGLKDVPLLGGLFKTRTKDGARSELMVTVTPRVIRNPSEYKLATDDLRRRVKQATQVEQSVRRR
jgi:general secretion pathway protein D